MTRSKIVNERRTTNRAAFMVRWYGGEGGKLVARTFATQREALAAVAERSAKSVEVFAATGTHGERWIRIS